MSRRSDLAPLMTKKSTPVERTSSGRIISWDPTTFSNIIESHGTTFHNLPVLSSVDALTFRPNDIVMLKGWDQRGRKGNVLWHVDRRIIQPGTDQAEQVVEWMRTRLARELIAETIHSDEVSAEETLSEPAGSSTSYEDLDTTGPSVSFETLTGRWIILLVAHAGVSGDRTAARMSYEATGAQTISPADSRSSLEVSPDLDSQGSAVYVNSHDGNAGEITVTAKYRVIPPAASPPPNGVASWQNRTLIVIAY